MLSADQLQAAFDRIRAGLPTAQEAHDSIVRASKLLTWNPQTSSVPPKPPTTDAIERGER